jgi:cytoskeletal protein CcmA (bactofilin family)
MFKKKSSPLNVDTVLGEYSSVTGNIETDGSIKLLGNVEGDIKAGGEVYIESTCTVKGNIYGSNVFVSGSVEGNILTKGVLHLMAQARLNGDIEVSSLVTDEGAIFQGSCRMIEPEVDTSEPSLNLKKDLKKSRIKKRSGEDSETQ